MSPRLRRWILGLLLTIGIGVPTALVAVYLINPFGVGSFNPRDRITGHGMFRIPGNSMATALQPGAIVFADMRHADAMMLARGEIVIYEHPGLGVIWAKRIAGLPGETLAITEGQLIVDGRPVAEPYVDPANAMTRESRELAPVKLGAGEYFLLGDNRDNSEDSRYSGPIKRDAIRGRLLPP